MSRSTNYPQFKRVAELRKTLTTQTNRTDHMVMIQDALQEAVVLTRMGLSDKLTEAHSTALSYVVDEALASAIDILKLIPEGRTRNNAIQTLKQELISE